MTDVIRKIDLLRTQIADEEQSIFYKFTDDAYFEGADKCVCAYDCVSVIEQSDPDTFAEALYRLAGFLDGELGLGSFIAPGDDGDDDGDEAVEEDNGQASMEKTLDKLETAA